LGDGTFHVPALVINPLEESTSHLATILGFGKLLGRTPFVQWNQSGANTEFFPTQAMIMFPIVCGIGQQRVKYDPLGGLGDCFGKLRGIVAGPPADH
jgi:hypothetical protein